LIAIRVARDCDRGHSRADIASSVPDPTHDLRAAALRRHPAAFILLVRMVRQSDGMAPEKRPFLILTVLYALQSVLIGLRWGYDVSALLPAQAVRRPDRRLRLDQLQQSGARDPGLLAHPVGRICCPPPSSPS
jgi:hypothetical protein